MGGTIVAEIFPIRPDGIDPYISANKLGPSRLPLIKRPNLHIGGTFVRPSHLMLDGPSGSAQIERRMMEVLLAFADADGAVLTREDLMARCWAGVTVGDDSVNRVIGGLRKAAVEVGGGFTIETVPRVGYRLEKQGNGMPNVSNGHDFVSLSEGQSVDPTRVASSSKSRRWLIAGGVAVLSAGGIGYWSTGRISTSTKAARLLGESRVVMRAGTPETDRQATALLEQAIKAEPSNADAWGLLALTKAQMNEFAAPDKTGSSSSVEFAANRALQLDKHNADAKAAVAIAIPYYGNWYEAERRFDAVLTEHPDHLATMSSRGSLLCAVGRMREGARQQLAPGSDASFDAHIHHRQIYSFWLLGRIEEADRIASRGLQMWPQNYGIWFGRLWVLAGTGRLDRAIVHIDEEATRPSLPLTMVDTLRTAMNAAKTKTAIDTEIAVSLVMAGVERSVAAVVNAMMLLNLLGATDKAFELARAYYLEQGPIIAANELQPDQLIIRDQRRRKTNMLFTPIASAMQRDSRFLPLMKQMGLTDYWNLRGVKPDFLT